MVKRGAAAPTHFADLCPLCDKAPTGGPVNRVEAVCKTGRKKLVLAGLWTEVCLATPSIQAAGEGWDNAAAQTGRQALSRCG